MIFWCSNISTLYSKGHHQTEDNKIRKNATKNFPFISVQNKHDFRTIINERYIELLSTSLFQSRVLNKLGAYKTILIFSCIALKELTRGTDFLLYEMRLWICL